MARANGFIDFEDGVDNQPIQSTIPGLRFTTTAGFDWIYGDWRTGEYNGKYPDGGATYLSVGISTANSVTLTGYNQSDQVIAQQTFSGGNLNTGRTNEMRVTAPPGQLLRYVIISGTANYWLIDDLSTDAAGVPNSRRPLVFIPGVGGSQLVNSDGELWPNMPATAFSSEALRVLRLQSDGRTPLEYTLPYTSVTHGDVIRTAALQDIYQTMIEYLGERGYTEADGTLIVFPYDWRKSITETVALLETRINSVKTTQQVDTVNILAHSMGGLVARAYIDDPGRASNVDTLVTLGTPYLGSPKLFQALRHGACLLDTPWCIPSSEMLHELVQNFPSAYQLVPARAFFGAYPLGYFNLDRDTDGDGLVEGWQDYDHTLALLRAENNSALMQQAIDFRAPLDDGFRNGTQNVNVYAFVGQGQATTGYIREYLKPRWSGGTEIAYDITPMNGDNAVPLHSGDLGRSLGADIDFSGSVSFYYAKLNHGQLASFNNGQTVLRLACDMLEVRGSPTAAASAYSRERPAGLPEAEPAAGPGLFTGDLASQDLAASDWLPIDTTPTPLQGRQLQFEGAISVGVLDPTGGEIQVSQGAVLTMTIPGASVNVLGQTTSIFLQDGGPYTIQLNGETVDLVDLRLRTIANDVVAQTVLFKDLEFTAATTGTLTYVSAAPTDQIALFEAGAPLGLIPPTVTLDATGSADVIPPTSVVSVQGTRGPQGWYVGPVTVTVAATDNVGGSGLAKIEYSLDGGKTVAAYVGPFTIPDAEVVATVQPRRREEHKVQLCALRVFAVCLSMGP